MVPVSWNTNSLLHTPRIFPATGFEEPGVKALFYEGLLWKDKPTRVFAWYGVPEQKTLKKLPAMILVHGGGGTAFPEWVRLWTNRGYAALAMDTCGCTWNGKYGQWPQHPFSGPSGQTVFDHVGMPVQEQWLYHAAADVILANSLLRSFPEIDPDRIGLTGISWGGIIALIALSQDHRFKFAAPVYGCGFLDDNSLLFPKASGIPETDFVQWRSLWDPSHYLDQIQCPLLWVAGTNDTHFPLNSLQKSYQTPKTPRTLCIRVRMEHAHGGPGENPEEIHAFANHYLKNDLPLMQIHEVVSDRNKAVVHFSSSTSLIKAELNFTCDGGKWADRLWQTLPAAIDASGKSANVPLPANITAYYFNLIDERNLIGSSDFQIIK